MSKHYELLEATTPYSRDGRTVWRFFADEYASDEGLLVIRAAGYPEVANRMRAFYEMGEYYVVVKLWDQVMDAEMSWLAANGHQWAINYLECCRDEEAVLDLVLKYGVERTKELVKLEKHSSDTILGVKRG